MKRTRTSTIARTAALLLAGTLTLAACGAGTPGGASTSAKESTLLIGTTTDVVTFSPLNNVSISDQWIMNQLYPDLFTLAADGSLTPHVAKSYAVSEDGTSLTIMLNDNFNWSDDEPITAEDVKFTLDRIVSDKLLHGATLRSNLASSEVISPTEIKINMASPSYGWALDLVRSAKILPQHVFKDVPNLADYPIDAHEDAWVSGGAFTLAGITKGQRYTFKRNAGYPLSAEGNKAITGLEFRIYQDINTMQLALQSGDLDLAAPSIPASAVGSLKGKPGIEITETADALNYSKLTFNASSAPLDNAVVRQVVSGLIDTQAILDSVLQGRGTHPVGPVLPVYKDYQPDITEWHFTADEAKQKMGSAGYQDKNNDGFFDEIDLKLLCDQGNANHAKSAQIVRDNLATAGIKVTLACTERATSLTAAKAGEFDLYIHKLNQINSPATNLALQYSSANTAGLYYNEAVDTKMDSLIQTAVAATTKDTYIKATKDAAAYIHDNAYVLPLYVEAMNNAFNTKRFTGYIPTGLEQSTMVNPYSLSQVIPSK
jgi:peptide/nickel transport system substrate-binding protein